MKLTILALALLAGCSDFTPQNLALLDENGAIVTASSWLNDIKRNFDEGITWLSTRLGLVEQPAYCARIVENSPTEEEFVANFPKDDEQYCPTTDDAALCKEQYNDAYKKGIACY